jgi:hypothetical protein
MTDGQAANPITISIAHFDGDDDADTRGAQTVVSARMSVDVGNAKLATAAIKGTPANAVKVKPVRSAAGARTAFRDGTLSN